MKNTLILILIAFVVSNHFYHRGVSHNDLVNAIEGSVYSAYEIGYRAGIKRATDDIGLVRLTVEDIEEMI